MATVSHNTKHAHNTPASPMPYGLQVENHVCSLWKIYSCRRDQFRPIPWPCSHNEHGQDTEDRNKSSIMSNVVLHLKTVLK